MLQEEVVEAKENATYREEDVSETVDLLKTYLSELPKHSILSKEEELEVAERAHRYKDRDASNRLVTSNLRLVVKIAFEYRNAHANVLDLIQEGNMELVHAVRKFDPYKGTRFSTYSSFWIRAYMLKYLMDSWSMVKIGTTQSQRKLFFRLNKEKKKLEAEGIVPTPQLLAGILDVKVGQVEEMEKRLAHSDISLETPVREEGQDTLGEMLKMDDNIEEFLAAKEKREILEQMIAEFKKTLSDKELFIFEERMAKDEPSTLTEIGLRFRVSRERVRQVESRVFKKFSDQFAQEFRRLGL